MKRIDEGRVARTAGLVVMTSATAAAIQHTMWAIEAQALATLFCIFIGACLAAIAADLGD